MLEIKPWNDKDVAVLKMLVLETVLKKCPIYKNSKVTSRFFKSKLAVFPNEQNINYIRSIQ